MINRCLSGWFVGCEDVFIVFSCFCRKYAKGSLILLPSVGFVYLVTFFTPNGHVQFDLFVRVLYPMQVRRKLNLQLNSKQIHTLYHEMAKAVISMLKQNIPLYFVILLIQDGGWRVTFFHISSSSFLRCFCVFIFYGVRVFIFYGVRVFIFYGVRVFIF